MFSKMKYEELVNQIFEPIPFKKLNSSSIVKTGQVLVFNENEGRYQLISHEQFNGSEKNWTKMYLIK